MDEFKFFDDYDPLPPLTALDKFCLTLCIIAGSAGFLAMAAELFR